MPLILTESNDAIGTIVLNHAAKRNALSEGLIDEFIAERKLKLLLNRVDYTGRIAVKLPEA